MYKATIVDLGELEPGTYTITAVRRRRRRSTVDDRLTRLRPDGPAARHRPTSPILGPVNLFDLVAVLVLVVRVLAGIRTGALPQVGGIGGRASAGCSLVLALAPGCSTSPAGLEPIPRALVVLGAVLAAVVIGEAVGSALGPGRSRTGSGEGVLSGVDRVAGGLARRRPGAS